MLFHNLPSRNQELPNTSTQAQRSSFHVGNHTKSQGVTEPTLIQGNAIAKLRSNATKGKQDEKSDKGKLSHEQNFAAPAMVRTLKTENKQSVPRKKRVGFVQGTCYH